MTLLVHVCLVWVALSSVWRLWFVCVSVFATCAFFIALAAHPFMYLRSMRFAFPFGDESLGRSICHLWISWVHIGIPRATAIMLTVFLWLVVFVITGSLPRARSIDCSPVRAFTRRMCVCPFLGTPFWAPLAPLRASRGPLSCYGRAFT